MQEKITLLNIDSLNRNIYPKHIFTSNNNILPLNPLKFKKDDNIVTINYPDHNLKIGDKIIMQNVEGDTRIIGNTCYLLNNFKYLIIILKNHNINLNYKQYTESLYINFELYGDQKLENIINNIPLNSILGLRKIYLSDEIPISQVPLAAADQSLQDEVNKIFTSELFQVIDTLQDLENLSKTIVSQNYLFIELPYLYNNQNAVFVSLKQVFKISYMHIGGIKLGYLNANFPINDYNYQSYHEIYNVLDKNTLQIKIKYKSYIDISGGGEHVQIMKILNTIDGFPNANNYTIDLKKSFNNVSQIELISTEFPYIDLIIKKNINDKLYWTHLEDGPYVYSIVIDEGSYTSLTLSNQIKNKLNNVERINNNKLIKKYNIFDVLFEINTQTIVFTAYNKINLPNSLIIRLLTINNQLYYILTVLHINNLLQIDDTIIITNANDTTINISSNIFIINATYINKEFKIYAIDTNNQTYDVILGLKDEIFIQNTGQETRGGENINIQYKTKVSFLFNKLDTIGDVIGFKNVGDKYSITEYNYTISNKDPYINSINLDYIGNELTYSSGFINLTGKYNYFLMYLNDIEYIYNNNLPSSFSKILLQGNPGDILFNTFIKNTSSKLYSKNLPIKILNQLIIKFLYPDGTYVNFRNMNHSFTLQITEQL